MNINFNDAHVKTLVKLTALVEKHGMKIRFGTTSNSKVSDDLSMLDEYFPKKILENLYENYADIIDGEIMMDENTLWFELYDPQPNEKFGKYHVMTYFKKDITFRLNSDWESTLEDAIDDYYADIDDNQEDDIDTEAIQNIRNMIEFIQNRTGDWLGVSFQECPTIINGFGNEKEVRNHTVYREGMALHFFTKLVCSYLEEPMINNTY